MRKHVQIVHDHTGDTQRWFNPDAKNETNRAKLRHEVLLSSGYHAYAKINGDPLATAKALKEFNPEVEETLYSPIVVSG